MEVKMSAFLLAQEDSLKELVNRLAKDYKYVSLLGTDTRGKRYEVQGTGISFDDSQWNERGFVLRIYNGVNYSEFSFNQFKGEELDDLIAKIRAKVEADLEDLKSTTANFITYPIIEEDRITEEYYGQVEVDPAAVEAREKINQLVKIKDQAFKCSEYLVDFRVSYEEVHVSKLFISSEKKLKQSYIWTQGMPVAIVRKDDDIKYYYQPFSGLKGVELLTEMADSYQEIVSTAEELLTAGRIKPAEYEIVCAPDVTGVIAHEAFGHGVEMDMFVKNRARAVDYLNKSVASMIVDMHDGAAAENQVGTYLFDDEGIIARDTLIIEQGILKTGLNDLLSALSLEVKPTGNGRRESFERKAYARMTNTFISPGNDKLEEMISSIEDGYLLEGVQGGMEDPKNWGIQLIITLGREIKNGRLTGKIVSPVVMTGYVPDVLESISMISNDIELHGTGACGKGHKEYVKVSTGGPYLKTKARLG